MTPRRAKVLGALAAVLAVSLGLLVSKLRPPPCSGAVFFEFRPPLGEPGSYQLSVDLDHGKRHCELEISLPLVKGPDKSRCPLAVELKTQGHKSASQLVTFAVGDAPEHVRLTVRHGKTLLYDAELTPEYSPYAIERAQGPKFCGDRAFVKPSCIRGTSQCWPFPARCDGPEDCKGKQVCCVDPEWGASYGPSTATECTSQSRCLGRVAEVACRADDDCPQGTKCRRAPYAEQFRGELSVCH